MLCHCNCRKQTYVVLNDILSIIKWNECKSWGLFRGRLKIQKTACSQSFENKWSNNIDGGNCYQQIIKTCIEFRLRHWNCSWQQHLEMTWSKPKWFLDLSRSCSSAYSHGSLFGVWRNTYEDYECFRPK